MASYNIPGMPQDSRGLFDVCCWTSVSYPCVRRQAQQAGERGTLVALSRRSTWKRFLRFAATNECASKMLHRSPISVASFCPLTHSIAIDRERTYHEV